MAEMQWQYKPAADLDRTLAQRLRGFPRQPDMLVYALRSAAALALRGWLRVFNRLRIEGAENLPASGSFVMVCNHASHLDALCLLSAVPLRRLHQAFPAAARDYFFVNLRRTAVAAIFINAIPFGRQGQLRQSLDSCRALLANPGNILILFPEGTRSKAGEMGEFRPGIGSLVAGLDVPVVPCALRGAFEALPKGAICPRPRPIRLTIGKARGFGGAAPGREAFAQIAAQLRQAVAELLCA
jgi:1-acyl-sn-glycerol-3-phosphate acyltransferase